MRLFAVGCGILGAALLIGAVVLAQWSGLPGGVGKTLFILMQDLAPGPRSVLLLLGLFLAMALVGGAVNLTGKASWSEGLRMLAFASAGLGLLAAASRALVTYQAAMATHTTNPKVIGPSVAEALLVAGFGLLVAAVAAGASAAGRAKAPAAA